MTSAVDHRRPVESNSQNAMRDSASTVLLAAENKTETGSSFKKILADGESQAQTVPAESGNSESNKLSATNKQVESEESTDGALKEQNHAEDSESVSSETTKNEKAEVKPIDPDLLTDVSLQGSVAESMHVDVGKKGLLESTDIATAINPDEEIAEIGDQAGLTGNEEADLTIAGGDKDQAAANVPVDQTIREIAKPATGPGGVGTEDVDSDPANGTAVAAIVPQASSTDLNRETMGLSEGKLSAEVPTAAVQVSDTNLARTVTGSIENISAKETATPVVFSSVSNGEAQPGRKTTELPVIVANSITTENSKSALLNDVRRQVQATPVVDTANSSAGVAVVTDLNTATRSTSFTLEGARPQTFEGLSQTAGNHIKMMMEQGIGRATVQLHPAELGSMRINIDLKADQLNVQISVVQGNTREALESALPRLRAQLEADGYSGININLEGGQTGDRRSGQMSSNDQFYDLYNDSDTEISNVLPGGSELATQGRRSLIDLFA